MRKLKLRSVTGQAITNAALEVALKSRTPLYQSSFYSAMLSQALNQISAGKCIGYVEFILDY